MNLFLNRKNKVGLVLGAGLGVFAFNQAYGEGSNPEKSRSAQPQTREELAKKGIHLSQIVKGTEIPDHVKLWDLEEGQKICYSWSRSLDDVISVRTMKDRKIDTANFHISGVGQNQIAQPKFSADGRNIEFMVGGDDEEHPYYSLYELSLDEGELQPSSKTAFNFSKTLQSPDGRFVAYISGGDYAGNPSPYAESNAPELSLLMYDLKQKTELSVVTDDNVAHGWSWSSPHTLYFTSSAASPSKKNKAALAAIFQIDAATKKRSLVQNQAAYPLVSPINHKIAFFGAKNVAKSSDRDYLSLCVVEKDGQERKPLHLQSGKLPALAWSKDEKTIFSVSNDNGKAHGEVIGWDVNSGAKKRIGQFTVDSYKEDGDEVMAPIFSLVRCNAKNEILCNVNAIIGKGTETYITRQVLEKMDCKTGQVEGIAESRGGSGFDIWNG